MLLTDQAQPTAGELTLIARLQTQFSCNVISRGPNTFAAEDLLGFDLAIITQGAGLPVEFRIVPVPMIVLHPGALAKLGMTGSQASDFGLIPNTRTVVGVGNHAATAGLAGTLTVLSNAGEIGWGAPARSATSIALDLQSRDHACIFCYELGDKMVSYLAPHRRAAFLLAADSLGASNFTDAGWTLFDACVIWAFFGAEAARRPAAVAPDAPATKMLSVEDYKQWVEENVAKQMIRRLTLWGFGGIAGILALVAGLMSATSHMREHVDQVVDTRVKEYLADKYGPTNIDLKVDDSLARMFYHGPQMDEHMDRYASRSIEMALATNKEKIDERARAAVVGEVQKLHTDATFQATVNTEIKYALLANRPAINEAANAAVTLAANDLTNFNKAVYSILTNRIWRGDIERRRESLQLFTIFCASADSYRNELVKIISADDDDPDFERVRVLALRNCDVGATDQERHQLFDIVLARLGRSNRVKDLLSFLRSGRLVRASHLSDSSGRLINQEAHDAYALILSRFPEEFAAALSAEMEHSSGSFFRSVAQDALAEMPGDQPALALVKLSGDGEPQTRTNALRALARRKSKFNDENNRQQALCQLWRNIVQSISASERKLANAEDRVRQRDSLSLDRLVRDLDRDFKDADTSASILQELNPAGTNDIDWDSVAADFAHAEFDYSDERDALYRALATNDWPLVESKLWPAVADSSRSSARLATVLLDAWWKRLRVEDAEGQFGAALNRMVADTRWVYDEELAAYVEQSVRASAATNFTPVIAKCHQALLDEILSTNATDRIANSALRVAVTCDGKTDPPYGASLTMISNCVALVRQSTNAILCVRTLTDLLDYCVGAESPRSLAPYLETNLTLAINAPCSNAVAATRTQLARYYVTVANQIDLFGDAVTPEQFAGALDLLNRAADLVQDKKNIAQQRGLVKVVLNDFPGAEADMQLSLERFPGSDSQSRRRRAGARENLGLVYLKRGEWERTLTNCAYTEAELRGDSTQPVRDELVWNNVFQWIAADKTTNAAKREESRARLRNMGNLNGEIRSLKAYLPVSYLPYATNALELGRETYAGSLER
ncbi:MAG TPA: hypothetical protein VHB20_07885 [Verrucomicrobiae bacterium]|nr:hypothetical protein [Verrucomicrobiae bacterium]